MKISGLDPGWLPLGVQRPEAPGGAAGGFADLLHQALRESSDAPAAALGPAPAPALQSVDPAAAVQTAARLESFLDLLEYYQQQLASPRVDMQVLSGAVRDVERGLASLTPSLNSLPENDGLKEILHGALVTASVEMAKFRRGDYPPA